MTFPHSIVRACIHKNVDFLRNVCGVFWSLQNAYCGVSRCMPLSRAVYQRKVHAIQPVHTCPLIHDMTWSLLLRYSTYMYPLLLIHHYTACAMLLIRYTTYDIPHAHSSACTHTSYSHSSFVYAACRLLLIRQYSAWTKLLVPYTTCPLLRIH